MPRVLHQPGDLHGDGIPEVGEALGEVDEVFGVGVVEHGVVSSRARHWEATSTAVRRRWSTSQSREWRRRTWQAGNVAHNRQVRPLAGIHELHRFSVGVISDTHGLLRPQAVAALRGCDLIVHAGDVGSPEILDGLRSVAPTFAVRGNVDRGAWAESLPVTTVVEAGPHQLYILHVLEDLDLVPEAAGFCAVISGHSHQPRAETRRGVLYLSPGSAGPRRFRLQVTIARLRISENGLVHEIVELSV